MEYTSILVSFKYLSQLYIITTTRGRERGGRGKGERERDLNFIEFDENFKRRTRLTCMYVICE